MPLQNQIHQKCFRRRGTIFLFCHDKQSVSLWSFYGLNMQNISPVILVLYGETNALCGTISFHYHLEYSDSIFDCWWPILTINLAHCACAPNVHPYIRTLQYIFSLPMQCLVSTFSLVHLKQMFPDFLISASYEERISKVKTKLADNLK